MILLLIVATFVYWLTPLILIILGLSRLKSRPENAKKLLLISAILLTVGLGFCGLLLN